MRSLIRRIFKHRLPEAISDNFRYADERGMERIESSLRKNYFSGEAFRTRGATPYLETPEGIQDLNNHLASRLDRNRREVIPWLCGVRPLAGARILEIGCGTGSSTVALAEQGARVTGLDIDGSSLAAARDRCEVYGLEAVLLEANAVGMSRAFPGETFDLIIFYASLEHMSIDERLAALAEAWEMLPGGGLLAVVETPNRLWHHDGHTARLPFFHWLPDDLAVRYSRFSPRERFNALHGEGSRQEQLTALYRWGRGVSYHEFDLALGRVEELEVQESLKSFLRRKDPLGSLRKIRHRSYPRERLLRQHHPGIQEGFCQAYLNLIIRK